MPVMGLRGRLALLFVAITVAPLTVAIGVVQAQIAAESRARGEAELERTGAAVAARIEAARLRAGDLATDLATREDLRGALESPGAADAWLARQPIGERADIVVLAMPAGGLLGHRGTLPEQISAASLAQQVAATAADPETPTGNIMLEVRVIRPGGLLATGVWLDDDLLSRYVATPTQGNGAALAAGNSLLAATGPTPELDSLPSSGSVGQGVVAGEAALVGTTSVDGAPGVRLVLWTPLPQGPGPGLVVAVVAAAAIAAVLGWVLAGGVVAPVRRAADVARAVAEGDLTRQLSPVGGRELAGLAEALNAMSAELAARISEVERSRDRLRRSLSRLGEALSGTLDLGRMLSAVAQSAADVLRADGAAVLLVNAAAGALVVKAVHGRGPTRPVGLSEGVAGHVVQTGQAVRLPGSAGVPARASTEPQEPYLLVVPLRGGGRTNGVLVLVRDATGAEFGDDDLATAASMAVGIGVAVENIRLHEETERLSLTNPVTGLWNNRYLVPQAEAELARARRATERDGIRREVSVLAIDLDRFGRINKQYSQAAGDAALAEVGRRLQEATREPDVVTHPHGEEFAVLLPDTDYQGALRVAERMRAAVARLPVSLPESGPDGTAVGLALTCSVGVATFIRHADDWSTLYRTADRAMQLAKDRGRNQVVGADILAPE